MDIATLKISIDTREAMAARRDLASVESQAAKTEQATVRMAKQSNQALGDMSGFIGRVAGALAAANLAQQFIRVADSVTVLNNQLKLAMGTAQAAGQAYKDLYIIAQQSRVSFTSLGGTFAQIRRATEDTGLSYGRLLTVTEAIGNAMAVSGGSAQGMNAALIQLQQGLASGTLRGEELNSVMEQTPRLAQAIADGLGITRGQLRAMGADGKLTSDAVIRALESQAGVLKGEVANATLTAGQSYTVMANATTKLIGQFDQLTGASAGVASAMKSVGSAMDGLGVFIENNKAGILAVTGALAGAAVVAGIVKMAGAIGLVTAAFTALTAVMAANPVGLVLLGIGAVGGAIAGMNAYNNAFAKTREGMVETIKRLEETNKSVEKSIYGPPTAAAMQHVEARRKQIEGLREEIEKLDAAANKAGGGSGSVGSGDTALMREQGKAYAALAAERQKFIDGAMTATQKMNAELEKARKAFGGMIPKNVEESIRGKFAGAIEKATDETRKLIDAGIELQKSLTAKDSGFSPEFAKQWESLGAAYKSGKLSIDQVLEAQRLLLEQQPFMIDAAKREADAINEAAKAQEAMAKLHEDSLKPFQQSLEAQIRRVESLQLEEAAVKMARELNVSLAQAVEMVNIAKLKEQQIAAMGNPEAVAAIEREIEERKKLIDLIGSKEAREAPTRAAAKAATDWKRTADKIEDALTDSLMRGFERGKDFGQNLKDTLENMFKTMVLRPVIQGVMGGVMGMGVSSAGASGIEGIASSMAQKYITSAIGGSILGSSAAYGAAIGTTSIAAGSQAAMLAAQTGSFGAAGLSATASAAGTGSSMMASAAAAGPYVLAAVGVLNALGVFRSNKTVGTGITGQLGSGDLQSYDLNRRGGSLFSGPKYSLQNVGPSAQSQALDSAFVAIRTGTAQMAKDLGFATAQIDAFTMSVGDVKVHPDIDRLGLVLDGLTDQQKLAKIEEVLQKSGNAMAELVLGAGATSQQLAQLYASVMQQRAGLEMQLLQAQGNVTEIRKRERDGLHESNRSLYDQIKALEDQKTAAEEATRSQAEAAQAQQALADAMAATASERKDLEMQLLQVQGNTAKIRELERESIHESNRALYDQILALEDQKIATEKATQAQAEAAAEAARAQQLLADAMAATASERKSLEMQLLQAQGNTAKIREIERESINESNRAIYDQIRALEDQRAATEKAAQAQAEANAKLQAIASERASLQDQLDQLLGNTEILRARERAALDESNRAIYDQIKALRDQKEAAELAAQAQSELAAKQQAIAQERAGLQDQLDQLLGNTEILRARERDALHESNRAIYDQIKALEDQKTANKDAAEAQRNALQTARNNTDAAYAALERAVNAQKRSATVTRDVAQQQVSSIKSIMDVLEGGIRNLFEGTREAAFQGMSFIDRALGTARSTGYLPDSQELQQAITGATQGVTGRTFATKADQIEAQRLLAFKLKDLQDVAGTQLTEAERQLEVANKQLESLDAILENAKSQIDTLRGIDNSIKTVADALTALKNATGSESQISQSTINNQLSALSKDKGFQDTARLVAATATAQQKGEWYSDMRKSGFSDSDIRQLVETSVGVQSDNDWSYLKGIAAFANGGMHSGGIRLVGERGPELEVTGPARYYSAAETSRMMSGSGSRATMPGEDSMVDELRALRKEVAMLRDEARATAINTGRTQDIMKRVTRNGESMIVSTDGEALEVTT
jgi:tape measure domain-containing protein